MPCYAIARARGTTQALPGGHGLPTSRGSNCAPGCSRAGTAWLATHILHTLRAAACGGQQPRWGTRRARHVPCHPCQQRRRWRSRVLDLQEVTHHQQHESARVVGLPGAPAGDAVWAAGMRSTQPDHFGAGPPTPGPPYVLPSRGEEGPGRRNGDASGFIITGTACASGPHMCARAGGRQGKWARRRRCGRGRRAVRSGKLKQRRGAATCVMLAGCCRLHCWWQACCHSSVRRRLRSLRRGPRGSVAICGGLSSAAAANRRGGKLHAEGASVRAPHLLAAPVCARGACLLFSLGACGLPRALD